jgi:hypothetical protein
MRTGGESGGGLEVFDGGLGGRKRREVLVDCVAQRMYFCFSWRISLLLLLLLLRARNFMWDLRLGIGSPRARVMARKSWPFLGESVDVIATVWWLYWAVGMVYRVNDSHCLCLVIAAQLRVTLV